MRLIAKTLFAAVILIACRSGGALAADPMRITIPGMISGFGDYFIAIDHGYFAQENIAAELVQAGGSTAIPALLAGDVQYATSPGVAISAMLRGGELKIIYVNNDHVPYQLWSLNADVKTLADLKGKQVGIETRGDTHELSIRRALVNAGMDPASVILTPLSNRGAVVAGVTSGSLAAASMMTDELERLRSNATAHMIFDLETIPLIAGGGVVSEKLLAENRPLVKRFLRAAIKGRRRADAFPDDVVTATRKRNAVQTPAEIRAAMESTRDLATKDGTISLDLQKQEIANRSEVLGIPSEKRRDPATMFDFSLLREVNAELDKEGWKP